MTTLANRPFLGAYALVAGVPEVTGRSVYRALRELPIAGLEVPLPTGAPDPRWWAECIAPQWDLVLTAIPGTVQRLARDPGYGIASTDEDGRRAALADLVVAADLARELAQRSGRERVRAIQVHSAPRAPRSSAAALARSLDELGTWDVAGALITLEHCDAPREGQRAQKGFLTLPEEISVLRGRPQRLTINWGRSAIERRSPAGALEHVRTAARAGLLAGLVFSGVSDLDTDWGPAWEDVHLPPSGEGPALGPSSTSLLTPDEVARALEAAQDVTYVGMKICPHPALHDVEHRVAVARAALALLDRRGVTGSGSGALPGSP